MKKRAFRQGRALPHIGAAKPLRTDFLCKAVIVSKSMKKVSRAMSSRVRSSAMLAVIVGSLCFSVGEGLRLTPFPVSTVIEPQEVSLTNPAFAKRLSQYGPLDVPAQSQKRSKRQVLAVAGPSASGTQVMPAVLSSVSENETTNPVAVRFVSRPAGRAPPLQF